MTIHTNGLSVRLGHRWILKDLSETFEQGQITTLCGPNGAGKSTLLRALAGDQIAARGVVQLLGQDTAHLRPNELARHRAVLAQHSKLTHPFEALDVVLLGPQRTQHALAMDILDELACGDLAHRRYTQLSGGERQLVQIARVLTQASVAEGPFWLLLDEPDTHLDLDVRERVHAALRRRIDRMGIITVMHDLERASRLGDTMLVLHAGSAIAHGACIDVLTPERLRDVWNLNARVTADQDLGGIRILPAPIH